MYTFNMFYLHTSIIFLKYFLLLLTESFISNDPLGFEDEVDEQIEVEQINGKI